MAIPRPAPRGVGGSVIATAPTAWATTKRGHVSDAELSKVGDERQAGIDSTTQPLPTLLRIALSIRRSDEGHHSVRRETSTDGVRRHRRDPPITGISTTMSAPGELDRLR